MPLYYGILCVNLFFFHFVGECDVMNNDIIFQQCRINIKYGTHVVRATRLQRAAKTYNNYCYYVRPTYIFINYFKVNLFHNMHLQLFVVTIYNIYHMQVV